ncbi:8-oxo-dGTP diphosphatase [Lewinella marina]|uniref:NUDIX hydrolase n=1 Tax=Neolewinella marina TaxID=438751 RepID=A0A2G0CGC9_9BACT|nr:NUDIX domain-containing protein [Neolewinella marina]NJB86528.1 8-oxo-dGTP diphosphatase [Neolewinella marina]PHK99018.1 NUDIX hydrolase [Neolewinella marina]
MDGTLNTRVTPQSAAATHTADCAVFGFSEGVLKVLLVQRNVEPFAGHWVLPGGAMGEDERLEQTARRVMLELVGVRDLFLQQVATYSEPDRHPVRRVVTTCYYALVKPENHTPVAKGYLSDVAWHPLSEVPPLGFDHGRLLNDAHQRLIQQLRDRPLAFDLLPDRFTLTEAQQLYEGILGEALDRRNFRRKILAYDFLIETRAKRAGVKGGPVLYRLDRAALDREMRK